LLTLSMGWSKFLKNKPEKHPCKFKVWVSIYKVNMA